jgi:hypothetical protein
MPKNVLDFETKKEAQLHKRKEAKIDALRNAFREARAAEPSKPSRLKAKKRRKIAPIHSFVYGKLPIPKIPLKTTDLLVFKACCALFLYWLLW